MVLILVHRGLYGRHLELGDHLVKPRKGAVKRRSPLLHAKRAGRTPEDLGGGMGIFA